MAYNHGERKKKKHILIYHLEINQPIKNPISIKVEREVIGEATSFTFHHFSDENYETIKAEVAFRFPHRKPRKILSTLNNQQKNNQIEWKVSQSAAQVLISVNNGRDWV